MLKKTLVIISLVIIAACQSESPTLPSGEVAKEVEKSGSGRSKYNGKEITVRGYTYGDVNMEGFGDVAGSIHLGGKITENDRHSISCSFSQKDAAEFSKIKGLQYVTVRGIFDDRNEDLRPCTLVKVEPQTNYPVKFVDRIAVFPPGQKADWQLLVIELAEDGKLTLNENEMGEIFDLKPLSEKLKAIFQEREKQSISEKEIVIEPKGKVYQWRINILIESLAEDAKAISILVIKNNS